MGFSGRLEGIAPSDIFQIISQNRMTGTLIARCQDSTAMVVFKDGQVIEAASDASQESLSSLLLSQGIVDEKTIETAEQQIKMDSDKTLGAVLVDMRAISAKALQGFVLKQITHIFHRLASCEDGFITFDRGETAVKRKINTREFLFPSGVSTEYLMMETARVEDEERRHVSDRREHAKGPLPGGGPLRETSVDAANQGGSGAAVRARPWWLREINLPKMPDLLNTAGSVLQVGTELTAAALQKGKELAKAADMWLHDSVMPRLVSVVNTVRAVSPDGRALIYAGAVGIAGGIALFLMTTLSSQPSTSELVITGRVVNVRAMPEIEANVVVQVDRGETVSLISSENEWRQVRTQGGATGWIWFKLAQQKESKATSVVYGMMGSGLVLVAGLALLVMGIMRRRGYREIPSASPK